MKITQVTPGIISIPPNGWGAIEKIVWNYKLALESFGHNCDIKYLDEVDVNNTDIVHIHVANLAIEAKQRGIPYIFSLHDHHVYRYGKNSDLYKQNLEAIKGSVISFCHAEFLVDFFEETDKLFYVSHGVDTTYFNPSNENKLKQDIKLLCVANNGYADDNSYDRKGFKYAIEAAKKLNLPITIVGPENNTNFFKKNKDLLKYKKLEIITKNVTEEELLEIYRSHSIFLHPSELEAGHPNLTILESISCFMPVVGVYDGSLELQAFVKADRNVDSIVLGINKVILNYEEYIAKCKLDRKNFDWFVIVNRMIKMYHSVMNIKKELNSNQTKDKYINTYSNTKKLRLPKKEIRDNISIKTNFILGAKVEINGNSKKVFRVEFWNKNNLVYSSNIRANEWCAPNIKYFINWNIKIYNETNLIYEHNINPQNQRVYIAFDSKSIGDNIAWMPYVEEFRKKYDCQVIVSTFWNDLFKSKYPKLEFVNPGDVVDNLYAMYKIGCFYDSNLEPELCNTIPLQKICSNILGLEHKEIKPLIDFAPKGKSQLTISDPYVVIAPQSTAGLKYWNNSTGWKEVVGYLKSKGYRIFNASREGCDINGVENLTDYSMDEIMTAISNCKFFIGLSSGISWLAWAMNKKVLLISNFTSYDHEFSDNCIRITNTNVCHNCWGNPNFVFDKGDWNWCPIHKGTDRQFECSKAITGKMVVDKIKELI